MGEKTIEELFKCIKQLSEKCDLIREDISNVKKDIYVELDKVNSTNKELKEENNILKEKVNTLEQKLKKYNLMVYGLKEEENEINDIQEFMAIIKDNLEIDIRFDDIRDIFRIGPKKEEKHRPLAIELVSYKLKTEILQKAKLLRGTKIFIDNDYTVVEYRKRKLLHLHLNKARGKNQQAFIRKNLLVVEGKSFTYQELLQKDSEEEELNESVSEEETQETQTIASAIEVKEKNCLNTTEQYSGLENKKRKQQILDKENPQKRHTRQRGKK